MARTPEQNRAAYQRRNEQARRLGYSGYAERRRALAAGRGRLGPDRTEGDLRKRVREFGSADSGGVVVQLTKNNRGTASVESRVRDKIESGQGGDSVTISYTLDGKSGPIRMSLQMSYDEFYDEWGLDAEGAAEGDAGDHYGGGSWSGAVGGVQVMIR